MFLNDSLNSWTLKIQTQYEGYMSNASVVVSTRHLPSLYTLVVAIYMYIQT